MRPPLCTLTTPQHFPLGEMNFTRTSRFGWSQFHRRRNLQVRIGGNRTLLAFTHRQAVPFRQMGQGLFQLYLLETADSPVGRVQITYEGENGIDAGGLVRQAFSQAFEYAFNTCEMMEGETQFIPVSTARQREPPEAFYRAAGRLYVGAYLNGCPPPVKLHSLSWEPTTAGLQLGHLSTVDARLHRLLRDAAAELTPEIK